MINESDLKTHEQLEYEFAAWQGESPENMVACSSGTAALHLALEALALRPGSEVLVPEFTMIACARAVTMAGLSPVFVDCNKDDLLMSVEDMQRKTTRRTTAVMPVHIYGRRCDMAAIGEIARLSRLCIVEDMAEAHGVELFSGTHAACWSFYCNKIVAGEEGGMVCFMDHGAAARAEELRCLGMTKQHDFLHTPRGHNYRMSRSHASLVLDSLRQVDDNVLQRKQIEEWYDAAMPTEWKQPARDVCWVYDIRIPGLSDRTLTGIIRTLNSQGIEARRGFRPMSMQPEYVAKPSRRRYHSTEAYLASQEVLYMPVFPGMTADDVHRNTDALCSAAEGLGLQL